MTSPTFQVVWKDGNSFALTETATWSGRSAWCRRLDGVDCDERASRVSGGSDDLVGWFVSSRGECPVVHPTNSLVEEELGLVFSYTVTDGDGDVGTGSLTVRVDDDRPISSVLVLPAALDDEAQSEFTPANTGFALGDVTPDLKIASGGAGALFTMGSDGLGAIAVTLPVFSVIYKDAQGCGGRGDQLECWCPLGGWYDDVDCDERQLHACRGSGDQGGRFLHVHAECAGCACWARRLVATARCWTSPTAATDGDGDTIGGLLTDGERRPSDLDAFVRRLRWTTKRRASSCQPTRRLRRAM